MAVVPLTLTISLCLVFTFVVFFLREHAASRLSGADRDSLLPLAEEHSRAVPLRVAQSDSSDDPNCGCRDGSRPPCPGCLKRSAKA